ANQRPLSRGVGAAAQIGGLAIGRAILEPGWHWSEDVKPIAGTEWCEVHHLQLIVSGRLAVRLADSDEVDEFVAGDLFDIPPRHDAWVVGDEPADLIDLSGNSAPRGRPLAADARGSQPDRPTRDRAIARAGDRHDGRRVLPRLR